MRHLIDRSLWAIVLNSTCNSHNSVSVHFPLKRILYFIYGINGINGVYDVSIKKSDSIHQKRQPFYHHQTNNTAFIQPVIIYFKYYRGSGIQNGNTSTVNTPYAFHSSAWFYNFEHSQNHSIGNWDLVVSFHVTRNFSNAVICCSNFKF